MKKTLKKRKRATSSSKSLDLFKKKEGDIALFLLQFGMHSNRMGMSLEDTIKEAIARFKCDATIEHIRDQIIQGYAEASLPDSTVSKR